IYAGIFFQPSHRPPPKGTLVSLKRNVGFAPKGHPFLDEAPRGFTLTPSTSLKKVVLLHEH
ncbi:hypothetical protein, partial [Alloprevotella sp. Lung230]|uniref:hypothetical protein n=1 Tax=Alloprevotella sp. Lung230 TaxID=2766595 RepID=UPI001CA3C7EA